MATTKKTAQRLTETFHETRVSVGVELVLPTNYDPRSSTRLYYEGFKAPDLKDYTGGH